MLDDGNGMPLLYSDTLPPDALAAAGPIDKAFFLT